jgi:glyoxylase-like metal-dependent hydrolase (beta-lactamase superfamily II)
MSNGLPDPIIQVVKESGPVRVHTFISPEALLSNATHVIEGPNELVIVDGQFVAPLASAFRAYADGLGKPINRAYLSHEHPDHFFGLSAAFSDVPIYALPETIAFLKANGEAIRADRAQVYGPMVPSSIVIPTHAVTAGREVIDGIAFDLVVQRHAEVETQLAIGLPEVGVYITQDLLYSGGHLYIHKGTEESWTAALEQLKASNYDLFLPGHGTPCGKEEIQANIDYLKTAKKIAAASPNVEAYKAALLAAFPDRKAPAIIDIYAPALFA